MEQHLTTQHDACGAGESAGGAILLSAFAALTGFWDWLKSTEKGIQVRRTVNAHGWTVVAVTVDPD